MISSWQDRFSLSFMMVLDNLIAGQWVPAGPNPSPLLDAVHGTSWPAALDASNVAACSLMAEHMQVRQSEEDDLQERGRMLKALALHLMENKEKFYRLECSDRGDPSDSWIDIEGGIGTLFAYASLRKQLPDLPYLVDGDPAMLSREGTFIGHHIGVPKRGVAVHINAYNFPVWGMLEKVSVNLLAGVPAIVKPASLTSYVAHAMVKEIHASGILPAGALQLVCGSAPRFAWITWTFRMSSRSPGPLKRAPMLKSHPSVAGTQCALQSGGGFPEQHGAGAGCRARDAGIRPVRQGDAP